VVRDSTVVRDTVASIDIIIGNAGRTLPSIEKGRNLACDLFREMVWRRNFYFWTEFALYYRPSLPRRRPMKRRPRFSPVPGPFFQPSMISYMNEEERQTLRVLADLGVAAFSAGLTVSVLRFFVNLIL
jgi:hypothetical protein